MGRQSGTTENRKETGTVMPNTIVAWMKVKTVNTE
jgi:hypothetical protein